MKTLSTDQQIDLQSLVASLAQKDLDANTKAQLNYWAIELKPKRLRRATPEATVTEIV